jgi:hypothetical protein
MRWAIVEGGGTLRLAAKRKKGVPWPAVSGDGLLPLAGGKNAKNIKDNDPSGLLVLVFLAFTKSRPRDNQQRRTLLVIYKQKRRQAGGHLPAKSA